MNSNYLWDRSGNDPDIERLEEQLAVFRYQSASAPAASPPEPAAARGPGRWWALGFAFSAIMAIVVGVGVWSGCPISEQVSEVAADELTSDRQRANISPQTVRPDPSPAVPFLPSTVAMADETADRLPRRSFHRGVRKSTAKVKREPVKLTPEERAAYDQVVLALAITSSKLKLVQDKVNGNDVGSPTAKDNK